MSFTTYWDLSERERAELTEAQVQSFTDAELMLKGVLKAPALELDPEDNEPALKLTTYYRIGLSDVVFATSEAAAQFLKLQPLELHSEYLGGGYYDSKKVVKPLSGDVVTVQASTESDFAAARNDLQKHAEKVASNRKRREEFDQAVRAQNAALQGLWEDWHRCRNQARAHNRVIETFASYVSTANGDEQLAVNFLRKVFTDEQLRAVNEWFGAEKIPTTFQGEPEPALVIRPQLAKTADDDIAF